MKTKLEIENEHYRHVKVPGFGCTYPHDFIDKNGTCSFQLQRLFRDEVVNHKFSSPVIVLPIEAGQGVLTANHNKRKDDHALDFEKLIVVPKAVDWFIKARTPILKVVIFEVSEKIKSGVSKEFSLREKHLTETFCELRLITRTNWINEVCHRYAFERSIAKAPDSLGSTFLEQEIVKEVYYACLRKSIDDQPNPFFVELPETLRKALVFIEKRLHDNLSAEDISAAAVTSKATLVRLFRSHLETTPIKYLWKRRLDEADRLLLSGRYTVAEVSGILGFSDSSTFSKRFNERFGMRPSHRLQR